MMNFESAEDFVNAQHARQRNMHLVQERLIPEVLNRLSARGYAVQLHAEDLGMSLNLIFADGTRWLYEVAIVFEGSDVYWMPVFRQ